MTRSAEKAVWNFANAILHGDNIHREWLLEAAAKFIKGLPLPEPRSKQK